MTSNTTLPESGAQVTIVVPTRNSARTITRCLQSIRRQTVACTIVVVDNHSSDSTAELAMPLADVVIAGGPERSAQRNLGAQSAPAPVVGFIDSDMILTPDVTAEARAAIAAGAGAVVVPEETVGEGYWARVRAYERSMYNGSDTIGAARFYRWDVFERAGGFDEDLTGAEDWDLTIEARRLAPITHIASHIYHDEGRVRYLDACAKKGYYADGLRRFVAKRGATALGGTISSRPWLRDPARLGTPLGPGLIALKAGETAAVAVALGATSARRVLERFCRRTQPGHGQDMSPSVESASSSASLPLPLLVGLFHRSSRAVVLSIRICRTMRQGIYTLARIGAGFLMPGHAGDVTFVTRQGVSLVASAGHYGWLPVVEVLIDDCYRLNGLVPELPADCRILDVGAHIGSFTVVMAKGLPGARITAFEPSAQRAACLRRNVTVNGLHDRVTVVQAAVGGSTARKRLGSTGIIVDAEIQAGGEVVEMVAFEQVVTEFDGPVDLLKMDCEGGEYEIVRSASDATLRRVDRLLMEYHPAPPEEVHRLFRRLAAVGLVERWREESVPGQCGVVCFGRVTS